MLSQQQSARSFLQHNINPNLCLQTHSFSNQVFLSSKWPCTHKQTVIGEDKGAQMKDWWLESRNCVQSRWAREEPPAGPDSQLKPGGGKTCCRASKGNQVFLVQIAAHSSVAARSSVTALWRSERPFLSPKRCSDGTDGWSSWHSAFFCSPLSFTC